MLLLMLICTIDTQGSVLPRLSATFSGFCVLCTGPSNKGTAFLSHCAGDQVFWSQRATGDQVVLVRLHPRHGHIGRGPAIDTVQPDGDMWQGHALDFRDGARIAGVRREAADLAAVVQLIAHHVHRQPLVGAGQDLQAFAAFVIMLDGGRHAVDKVVFFVEVLGEKEQSQVACVGPW